MIAYLSIMYSSQQEENSYGTSKDNISEVVGDLRRIHAVATRALEVTITNTARHLPRKSILNPLT